jgi:hypothetical protein
MRWIFSLIVVIALMLTACHIIEINMVQRAVLDSGDGTSDEVRSSISKPESEKYDLIAPIK